jgi:glyoxylase-like metal-dependent hydrolase (beta-lactamase superfamily II)
VKRTSIKKIYLMLIGLFFTLQSGFAFAAGQTIENPVIGEKGYHVGSYGNGAYWITNGLYNSMFIVSDEGVIVVDAPPSYADKIPAAIKEVTDLPVKYFVYSHHHNDHTGGSAVFGNEVIRVGHELTAQELRRKADPNRPVPTVTFSDTYTLELGNQRVELAYPGLQHSPGNIFVYLPTQKVLMMVDVLYPGSVPFNHFAVAASVPGFYDAFDQADEYDFEFFQGGHVGRPGNREDFADIHGYIKDVHNNAMMAMQNTSPPVPFFGGKLQIAEPYFAINGYIEAASKVCAQLTMEKWRGRLNTVDVFTEGHCWTAVVDLMID